MSGRFLVTGLPRSRTAWFAALLSSSGQYCPHEPTADVERYEDLEWPEGTGISDSCLSRFLGRTMADFSPRVLVIVRPEADVVASVKRMAGEAAAGLPFRTFLQDCRDQIDRHALDDRVLHIAYGALNNEFNVRACLDWITPGIEYPALPMFMHLNVQSDWRFNLDRARGSDRGKWVLAA